MKYTKITLTSLSSILNVFELSQIKLSIKWSYFQSFFPPLQLNGTKIKGWKIETWMFNLRVTLADFSKHSFPAAWLQGRTAAKSFMRASLPRKAHHLYANNLYVGILSICRGTVLKMGLNLEKRGEQKEGLGERKSRRTPPWSSMPRYLKYFVGFKLCNKYKFQFIYFP